MARCVKGEYICGYIQRNRNKSMNVKELMNHIRSHHGLYESVAAEFPHLKPNGTAADVSQQSTEETNNHDTLSTEESPPGRNNASQSRTRTPSTRSSEGSSSSHPTTPPRRTQASRSSSTSTTGITTIPTPPPSSEKTAMTRRANGQSPRASSEPLPSSPASLETSTTAQLRSRRKDRNTGSTITKPDSSTAEESTETPGDKQARRNGMGLNLNKKGKESVSPKNLASASNANIQQTTNDAGTQPSTNQPESSLLTQITDLEAKLSELSVEFSDKFHALQTEIERLKSSHRHAMRP
ncbi:uncharacterized protein SPPG_02427 [Spizellomyces punctatus DAOM BR117]|uniref:Uncharacterized protein n=1 Tax=Spizellomyces punctatus (strain DAOM BR117) TaxID=645134 RepID=A0A0L0HM73_SPIPD|nr:uncharacterized protein SPPG_02427 [Spizellomyces punctatus DAOM BR117]KND01919.1 hypothetical protein SPPG_02427 [Spizellomyces punctatus DAOM BR117]|eukprot:XP_016609958.1 hypothetical protein SPPG_02427 [Spizellomyces punctatus DAOM BR117]